LYVYVIIEFYHMKKAKTLVILRMIDLKN